MTFNVVTAKLTGNPTSSGLVQVHDFASSDNVKHRKANLYIVVATRQENESESANLAKSAINNLHDRFYSPLQNIPNARFDEVVGEAQVSSGDHHLASSDNVYVSFTKAVENTYFDLLDTDGDLGLAVLCIMGDVLYTAVAGESRVVLFREGKLITILKGRRGISLNASGFIKDSDTFVCGTEEFFSFFNKEVLISALQGNDPTGAVEVLAPSIHAGNGGGRIGAIILQTVVSRNITYYESGVDLPDKKEIPVSHIPEQEVVRKQPISLNPVKFLKKSIKVPHYDTPDVSARKKTYALLGVFLILLLAASTVVGIRQRNIKVEKETYQSRLNQARHGLEESVNLYQLDPKRSRELFVASREVVEGLVAEGVEDPLLDELRNSMTQNEGRVLGEFTGDPETFLNLSLLSSGFNGDTLIATTKRMYVLDKEVNRVVAISFDTKRSEVIAGPTQIKNAKELTAFSDNVYVHQEDGIYSVGKEAKKVIANEWTGEIATAAYLGNIYIVEKAIGRIWRYPATASGFGNRQSWLLDGLEPDFTNIKNIVIDGSIWLLSSSGQIFKYTSGYQRDFRITGLFPELNSPAGIYTNEDLELLYVLDNENSRIVVLDKSGEFKYQYIAEELKDAKGLAVSEKDRKIIFLREDKLFSIDLRH